MFLRRGRRRSRFLLFRTRSPHPGEEHPVLHAFPEQRADEHQQYYKYELVNEDTALWYWFMSTEPIKDELYAPLLIYRLKTIDLDDQKAVDFALTTHTIDGRKLVEGTTVASVI